VQANALRSIIGLLTELHIGGWPRCRGAIQLRDRRAPSA